METIACAIGGAALILCGLGLSRLRPPDWTTDGDLALPSERSIARWAAFQRAVRRFNNTLMVAMGATIITCGLIGHSDLWLVLWFVVLLAMLVCILLAVLDAVSSLAGYRSAVPEAVRRSFRHH